LGRLGGEKGGKALRQKGALLPHGRAGEKGSTGMTPAWRALNTEVGGEVWISMPGPSFLYLRRDQNSKKEKEGCSGGFSFWLGREREGLDGKKGRCQSWPVCLIVTQEKKKEENSRRISCSHPRFNRGTGKRRKGFSRDLLPSDSGEYALAQVYSDKEKRGRKNTSQLLHHNCLF